MNAHLPLLETPVRPHFNPAAEPEVPGRTKRVLVVDDDMMSRRFVALMLAHAGYAVDTAEDGEQGWDALRSAHYDLLVTDNDMPHLTGLQLVERLRVGGSTLPVIIASGSVELGDAQDYPWLELAALLHKPFSFSDLIPAARRAAPTALDAGEGTVHCLESQRDDAIHFPFPARKDARPEVFAQTA